MTWEELLHLSFYSPHVHAMVYVVSKGLMSREDALMSTVKTLADALKATQDQLVREISERPPAQRQKLGG